MLAHRFKKRALNFRRRAVDFVGQNEIGENRAFSSGKIAGFLIEDHRADQIGRQKIGRELNALKVGLNHVGQSLDRQRFGQPGKTFEQNVAIAEQREQQALDQNSLADDDFGGFRENRVHELTALFDLFGQRLNVHCRHAAEYRPVEGVFNFVLLIIES